MNTHTLTDSYQKLSLSHCSCQSKVQSRRSCVRLDPFTSASALFTASALRGRLVSVCLAFQPIQKGERVTVSRHFLDMMNHWISQCPMDSFLSAFSRVALFFWKLASSKLVDQQSSEFKLTRRACSHAGVGRGLDRDPRRPCAVQQARQKKNAHCLSQHHTAQPLLSQPQPQHQQEPDTYAPGKS